MKRRREKLKNGDEVVIHHHSKERTKEEEWREGGRPQGLKQIEMERGMTENRLIEMVEGFTAALGTLIIKDGDGENVDRGFEKDGMMDR